MGVVQERYTPLLLTANSTSTLTAGSLSGFLCKTAGTITVTKNGGDVVVDAFPVAAGVYYPMPFFLGGAGGKVTLAGGASGTLAIF